MKMWKKIMTAVLAGSLMLGISMVSMAAEPEGYKYTVNFSAGNHGTFENGTDEIIQKDLPAGSTVSFTAQTAVTLEENSKYYVKGVRLSGRDNADVMATLTIDKVEKDEAYVVVYGIKGNQVSYTVKYQDAKGKELAPDEVFYGNVGDKPVVAYKYISGYRPKALGLTKTLSENEAENVFIFEYTGAAEGSGGTKYVDGPTTIIYNDRYVPGTGGAGAGGQANDEEDEGTAGQGTGEETPDGAAGEESTQPQEIVDLDDEETPLGEIDLEEAKEGLPMAGMLTLLGVCVAALIALVILLMRLKKRGKKEEEENSEA